ncbi:MAG: PmeII family type II restriction endonuclease, partial [Candidatus Thermoplasmatota archaeon]
DTLKLKAFLRKKNPYLYRAIGTEKASEIVEEIMRAYFSSSDEATFGNAFFEPIAKISSKGIVSPSEGVDIALERRKRYTAISVKSGPNWGNSSQIKKLIDNFNSLRSRLYKIQKQFDPVVGHGYGRLNRPPSDKRVFRDISGQKFWTELTGDSDFYLKLVRLMRDYPAAHRIVYKKAWDATVNKHTADFIKEFCRENGSIDWEKLVEFNSGDNEKEDVV